MHSHTDVEAAAAATKASSSSPAAAAAAAAPESNTSSSRKRTLLTACVVGALGLAALCATAASAYRTASSSTSSPVIDLKARSLQEPVPQRRLGRRVTSGVYNPGFKSVDNRRGEIGDYPSQLLYQEIDSLSYWWQVRPYLDRGLQVQQTIVFSNHGLKALARGEMAGELAQFARNVRDGGKEIYVRIFHEMNGNWYNWNTYNNHNGNSKQDFINAYNTVAGNLKSNSGGLIKMQLAYNCDNPNKDKSPQNAFSTWWPGPQNVDMVCCSAYNMAGVDGKGWESFSEVFDWGYWQMNSLPFGGPLCVAETSSTDARGGGAKADWFRDAANTLSRTYGRVTLINWFLWNEYGARTYDVNDGAARSGVRDAINILR